VSNTICEHLLDVGVRKHLQSIGVVEPLLNVQIAPLAILYINKRAVVAPSTHHTIQLQLVEVMYDGLPDLINLLACLGVIKREALLRFSVGIIIAAGKRTPEGCNTMSTLGKADGVVLN